MPTDAGQDPQPPVIGSFRIRLERDQSVVVEFRTFGDGALVARVPLSREAADALSAALSPDKRAEMYRLATSTPSAATKH